MHASLKLRQLLIGLFGLLAAVAFAAIGWNLVTARQHLAEAQWTVAANRLGDLALRASTTSGMERGLTAMLLASARQAPVREGDYSRLAQVRADGEASHDDLRAQLQLLQGLEASGFMQPAMRRYEQSHTTLGQVRKAVDACLASGPCMLADNQWLEAVNGHIRALAMLRRLALSARHDAEHPYADNPLAKEVLFTLAEYAGRERALAGRVIAEARPFTAAELAAVNGYRGVIDETLQKLDMMVAKMPQDTRIADANTAMRREFLGRFEALRERVYTASARKEPYPVNAAHWFQAATTAIDSIVALSNQFSEHAQADIRLAEAGLTRNIRLYLAAGVLALVVLLATLFLMRRRVLLPLRHLELAAHTMARGDLRQPLVGFHADELGEVAAAFESMRARLLEQMQERRRAEAQAHASLQRFRGLVESINDLIWETDREGLYTYVSPQIRTILGYEPEEVLGKSPLELMPSEEVARLDEHIAQTLAHPAPFQGLRNIARHRAGHLVTLETNGTPVFDDNGAFAGYRGIDRDLTWRMQAEEESARLLRVVEQTDDLVIITDPEGFIRYVNAAFERITGYPRDEVIGRHTRLLKSGQHDEAFYRRMWQTISSGESFHAKMIDRRKSGELFRTEHTISPLRDASGTITHYVGTAKDITERHRLDEQLQQSEKLASIGQLAAGVAHEINNPVGYISSNLNTLGRYAEDLFSLCDAYAEAETALADPAQKEQLNALKQELGVEFLREDLRALIEESTEGVRRVKKIVQDLKDFSRQEAADWQLADLHKGLESTLNIAHNEIKYKAEVVRDYGELPEIECVPSQLNQVFMNLLVNAAHAIEQRGTITVRTGHAGDAVWVEVEDTGQGIAPENLKRIFEPFFTTKPVGKGTGLGLSLSYGIVQKHGGRIEIDSALGRGTRFRVWLPVRQTSAPITPLSSGNATMAA